MKASRRNREAAIKRAQRLDSKPPKVSKYAAKNGVASGDYRAVMYDDYAPATADDNG